jgi:hypothetical protein
MKLLVCRWKIQCGIASHGRQRNVSRKYSMGRVARPFTLGFFFPVMKLWVPRPCVLCKGGYDAADIMGLSCLWAST